MSGAHHKSAAVSYVIADLDAGRTPDAQKLAEAVRSLLGALAAVAPGRSVEVRVPPYGAVQCVEGPRHTRGTPPNVIETDPVSWVRVATGRTDWTQLVAEGRIQASGPRTDISHYFPLAQ